MWQAQWHMQNWIDCIRTRKKPVSDVEIAHRSVGVCHLANITRWVGRRLKWDPVAERFQDDDEANGSRDSISTLTTSADEVVTESNNASSEWPKCIFVIRLAFDRQRCDVGTSTSVAEAVSEAPHN